MPEARETVMSCHGLAFCRRTESDMHFVFYEERAEIVDGEIVIRKLPSLYLSLPLIAVTEALELVHHELAALAFDGAHKVH